MNILYLRGADKGLEGLMPYLMGPDDWVTYTRNPVDSTRLDWADWIVSYGYRHILPAEVCERFDGRAVNLHIGLLPWNRGAHPNFWSAAEGTPSGVTLHYMAARVDRGDVIAQQEVTFGGEVTLRESHASLQRYAEGLFAKWWPVLREGRAPRVKQTGAGSYHRIADLPADMDWDCPRGMICGNVFA